MEASPPGARGPAEAADERHLMTVVARFLFLVAGAMALLGLALPHSPQANVPAFWALAGSCAAIVALLRVGGERLPAWTFQPLLALGTAMTGFSVYYSGERLGGAPALNEMLYLWVALYAGYFFSRRWLAAQLALIAGSYAAVLALVDPGPVAVTRWLIAVGMVTAAGTLVRLLRERVDALVRRLGEAARTDPLTELLNLRGFDARFALELERARRTGAPLALVLGDLDRFKELNDLHGHPAGDGALTAVGAALRDGCRRIDAAARVGGEEFAVLAPDTDATGALLLAERLRAAVAAALAGGPVPLTMSFGVVTFPAHGETAAELRQAADQALYAAKELGRDRSVIFHAEVPALLDTARRQATATRSGAP